MTPDEILKYRESVTKDFSIRIDEASACAMLEIAYQLAKLNETLKVGIEYGPVEEK